jgi:hypothetical protein
MLFIMVHQDQFVIQEPVRGATQTTTTTTTQTGGTSVGVGVNVASLIWGFL